MDVIKQKRKAAFFLLSQGYIGRPLDVGVIEALRAEDYVVDVFVPGVVAGRYAEYDDVSLRPIIYRSKALLGAIRSGAMRNYDLLVGTCDLPMAFVAALNWSSDAKAITVCDEVYVGGYEGHAKGALKWLCSIGMRRSSLTIITDHCREGLYKEYAKICGPHIFSMYPCCFPDWRFEGDRESWRKFIGAQRGDIVLSFSGKASESRGGHWAFQLTERLPSEFKLFFQPGRRAEPVTEAAARFAASASGRMYVAKEDPSFIRAMSMNLATDIGLVFYIEKPLQSQYMGLSSNKLCMYLQMGLPVVATRQPSFGFLEKYGAGLLVESVDEAEGAVLRIREDYEAYSRGAKDCYERHIRPSNRLAELRQAIRRL